VRLLEPQRVIWHNPPFLWRSRAMVGCINVPRFLAPLFTRFIDPLTWALWAKGWPEEIGVIARFLLLTVVRKAMGE